MDAREALKLMWYELDLEAVAELINGMRSGEPMGRNATLTHLARRLAELMKEANPNFDAERFKREAGIQIGC